MRFSILTAAVLLLAVPAQAQFSNRSLGVGATFNGTVADNKLFGLTLEGSYYIENGFDVYVRIPFLFSTTKVGADSTSGEGLVFGLGTNLGVRYLFLEESLRPYLGAELAMLILFLRPEPQYLGGVGAIAGIDWFFTDSFSVGLRGSYTLLVEPTHLNQTPRHHLGAMVSVSTFF